MKIIDKKELEKLSKKELVDTIYNILVTYSKDKTKLPWVTCPVCNQSLNRK